MTASFLLQCIEASALCDPLALLTLTPREDETGSAGGEETEAFPALIEVALDEPEQKQPKDSSAAFPDPVVFLWQPPAATPLMVFALPDAGPNGKTCQEAESNPAELILSPATSLADAPARSPELTLPTKEVSTPPVVVPRPTLPVEVDHASAPPTETAIVELTLRPKETAPVSTSNARPAPERPPQGEPDPLTASKSLSPSGMKPEQPVPVREEDADSKESDPAPAERAKRVEAVRPPAQAHPEPVQSTAAPAPVLHLSRPVLAGASSGQQSSPTETPRLRETAAAAEPERVESPRQLAQLSLRVSEPGRPSVRLHVVEKPEGIQVKLLTNDESVAAPLRRELPQLIQDLDRQGLKVESTGASPAPAEERRERHILPVGLEEQPARDSSDASSGDRRRHSGASPEDVPEPSRNSTRGRPDSGFYSVISSVSSLTGDPNQ